MDLFPYQPQPPPTTAPLIFPVTYLTTFLSHPSSAGKYTFSKATNKQPLLNLPVTKQNYCHPTHQPQTQQSIQTSASARRTKSSTTDNMSNVLTSKDANAGIAGPATQDPAGKPDIKSMEYHRQVLQNKMESDQYVISAAQDWKTVIANTTATRGQQYISPSDNIMSPCTAKLSAFRTKQVGKYVTAVLVHPFLARN